MTPDYSVEILKGMMTHIVMVAAPLLLAGMTVGLIISLFQAVTSLQEQTLAFAPKALAVTDCCFLFFRGWCAPWWITQRTSLKLSREWLYDPNLDVMNGGIICQLVHDFCSRGSDALDFSVAFSDGHPGANAHCACGLHVLSHPAHVAGACRCL